VFTLPTGRVSASGLCLFDVAIPKSKIPNQESPSLRVGFLPRVSASSTSQSPNPKSQIKNHPPYGSGLCLHLLPDRRCNPQIQNPKSRITLPTGRVSAFTSCLIGVAIPNPKSRVTLPTGRVSAFTSCLIGVEIQNPKSQIPNPKRAHSIFRSLNLSACSLMKPSASCWS
jgi:hypothetical protein